jgi:hypothetical protein
MENFSWISKRNSFLFFISFLFLSMIPAKAQQKRPPIFPSDDPYFKNWGWYAGLGTNFTLPISGELRQSFNFLSDTLQDYTFSPKGRLGAMIEGGAFYLLDNYIVSYVDGGIRVNWFNGKENFTEYQVDQLAGDTIAMQEGYRSFSMMNASLRLAANNTIQVSKYGFIQNSLGLNVDYTFYKKFKLDPEGFPFPYDPLADATYNEFQFQLHYKIAYGFRLDLMHYMIIGIDAPIFTIAPWQDGRQTIDIYHSNYWPLTLSVRVLFLRKSNRPDCKKPPPLDMNKKRKEAKMF